MHTRHLFLPAVSFLLAMTIAERLGTFGTKKETAFTCSIFSSHAQRVNPTSVFSKNWATLMLLSESRKLSVSIGLSQS